MNRPSLKVETPVTFNVPEVIVSEIIFAVEIPAAVTVTIPADILDTSKFVPKFIVPAVPTADPLSFTTTPDPEATIPVSPEPSPTNLVAVATPVILILPVPVIVLLNKSKLPPSCGVTSSTILSIPVAPPLAITL
mgnify:CR=1 FL=1